MRLLIDEMYPSAIAEQLRGRGHDASAVVERHELRASSDAALFALAQQERRAVVTENVGDFVVLASLADQRAEPHHGLVLVDPVKYPQGNQRTIGRLVRTLDALLADRPDDRPHSARDWV